MKSKFKLRGRFRTLRMFWNQKNNLATFGAREREGGEGDLHVVLLEILQFNQAIHF